MLLFLGRVGGLRFQTPRVKLLIGLTPLLALWVGLGPWATDPDLEQLGPHEGATQ